MYDPRTSGLSQYVVDGQSLSLHRVGDYYETSEFVCVEPGAVINWQVPYQQIVLDDAEVETRYNPPRRLRGVRPKSIPLRMSEYVKFIREETPP